MSVTSAAFIGQQAGFHIDQPIISSSHPVKKRFLRMHELKSRSFPLSSTQLLDQSPNEMDQSDSQVEV